MAVDRAAFRAEFGMTPEAARARFGTARRTELRELLGLDRTLAALDGAEVDPEVLALKAELRVALRKLHESHDRQAELRDAARAAATQAIRALSLPAPVKSPPRDQRGGKEEVAISVLGDWQLAKVTRTYNSDVCEERIEVLGDKIEQIVAVQRQDHPVRRLWVPMVGDLIEGEMIFPGQAHLIDASLFRQVLIDGPRILGGFLRRMLGIFERVDVDGVIGNHGAVGGRGRRDYHPETNGDAMMYEVTRQVLEASGQDRLNFSANYVDLERMWYKVRDINGKRWLLIHGDQARGGNGISGLPFPTLTSKVLKWGNGGIPEDFNYVLCGHYHTPTRMTIGNKKLWMSGSTESDNTYASEFMAAMGQPTQWLLFASSRGNVTGEYEVRLNREEH